MQVFPAQGGKRILGPVKPVPDSVSGSPFTVLNSAASNTPSLIEGVLLVYPVQPLHIKVIESQKIAAVSAVTAAAGTGYAVDDLLTVDGGSFKTAAVFRVTGETAGVIDTVSLETAGEYTLTPANPASTTGGGNGDATLTVTYSAANPDEADVNDILLPAAQISQIGIEDGDVLSMFNSVASDTVYVELAKTV